ncbi:MAG: DNA-directed RNA polymerase subunit omega [Oscillatoria sp. PMC 1051.18]|uniref:DNA-directed RNA polymerase subunit omega n=1 Tax=Oscillatoria salina TaxID=331517 RepID=UPI0013B936E4|nr:DNA-directed RNA polymerase subunit omega [Oscillatoria salina]MEC4893514.1 DNA-directed RNA polymerase subunit omega [Oscillatoria sp. PMC 1050.18]MEC4986286.1 DNA-directed RNA polymerase subunit omega [Oscillatoria sp. PMC 1076.18]MEC4991525.1 DNA-directed RNA polymerase subunit omega [Oscillatoria sp. PMC 1068.18]MEC5030235.1 DNA-directed RNA polymerase subunit omega [Oscillatoria sp. PMC 1051.18]NET88670.1 DNA-directed RNA polymerase subunit omega [Kamptonema sp. SIO1D9]
MSKRLSFNPAEIMNRSEDLMSAASNRYRITVQVANRAKRRRDEEFNNNEDPMMKPVIRAIIEMSDELTQPEIIGE